MKKGAIQQISNIDQSFKRSSWNFGSLITNSTLKLLYFVMLLLYDTPVFLGWTILLFHVFILEKLVVCINISQRVMWQHWLFEFSNKCDWEILGDILSNLRKVDIVGSDHALKRVFIFGFFFFYIFHYRISVNFNRKPVNADNMTGKEKQNIEVFK